MNGECIHDTLMSPLFKLALRMQGCEFQDSFRALECPETGCNDNNSTSHSHSLTKRRGIICIGNTNGSHFPPP